MYPVPMYYNSKSVRLCTGSAFYTEHMAIEESRAVGSASQRSGISHTSDLGLKRVPLWAMVSPPPFLHPQENQLVHAEGCRSVGVPKYIPGVVTT